MQTYGFGITIILDMNYSFFINNFTQRAATMKKANAATLDPLSTAFDFVVSQIKRAQGSARSTMLEAAEKLAYGMSFEGHDLEALMDRIYPADEDAGPLAA